MSRLEPGPRTQAAHRPPALAAAVGLDALAVALFAVNVAIVTRGGPEDTSGEGFFADPLPAVLLLLAATAVVAAGAVAAVSLARAPLHGRSGRWAMRLAVLNALLMPVVGLSVTAIAWLVGYDLPEGWGEPLAPVWLVTAVAAVALGAAAKEPGRRGLLILPFVIGAAVLTFWLGEILAPH